MAALQLIAFGSRHFGLDISHTHRLSVKTSPPRREKIATGVVFVDRPQQIVATQKFRSDRLLD